jgi:beta-phosphoglucomutase-like phosphatase (HAD superfamily)
VLTAIMRLGVADVRDVAVVTASESGVMCARRAGSRLIVGVPGQVHDASRLRRAGATHLLADLGELPDLVGVQGVLGSQTALATVPVATASD